MDMKDEKPPKIRKLLPEGWRRFLIVSGKEEVSKGGNEMIVFTIRDQETGYEEPIYAVSKPGKRWFLKQILTSVGCQAGQDGVYNWEMEDVVNNEFLGLVEHEPNEYINREGDKVTTTQHRITDVKECAWDEK